jgi:hypothetical protein
MMDIQVARVPRRIFSITVLPDRIYCCTNEHITVVDFRDVSGKGPSSPLLLTPSLTLRSCRSSSMSPVAPGVEVAHKPKKYGRSRRGRENCLLQ